MTKEILTTINVQPTGHLIIQNGSHEVMAVGVTIHTYDDTHIIHCLKVDGSKEEIHCPKISVNAPFLFGSVHLNRREEKGKTIVDTVACYQTKAGLLTWSKHSTQKLNHKFTITELSVEGRN